MRQLVEGRRTNAQYFLDMSIFCTICGAVFRHVASLKYHLANQVCTKPRKGKSPQSNCPQTNVGASVDEEGRKLQCPVCDKSFKGITAMQYHIRRRVCEQVKVNVGKWLCPGSKIYFWYNIG